MTTTVIIADDHPIVLRGLTVLIDSHAGFKVVAAESNGTAALRAIVDLAPDIAVLDLNMPGKTGLDLIREYLAALLPGLADVRIQKLADLTPAAWAARTR